jgi:transposase
MVEESFQPGASVARVARAHGVNANQVFGWRRLYQRGRLGTNTRAAQAVELLPVTRKRPKATVLNA